MMGIAVTNFGELAYVTLLVPGILYQYPCHAGSCKCSCLNEAIG